MHVTGQPAGLDDATSTVCLQGSSCAAATTAPRSDDGTVAPRLQPMPGMRPVLGLLLAMCVLPGHRDKHHGPLEVDWREAVQQFDTQVNTVEENLTTITGR